MERGWKPNVEISPNCPRCGSSNTKFCYYNNYSLTQPRYFCKHCRRYWTKGGSLRNVPVGGGCRKNRRTKSLTLTPSPSTPQKNQVFCNDNNSFNFESRKNRDGSSSQDIDLAIVYANFLNQNKPHSKDQLKPCDEFDPCFQFSGNDNLLLGDHENGVFGFRSDSFCEFPMKEYGNLGEMDQDENMAFFEKKKNEIELAPLPGEDIVVGWSNSSLIMVNNNHSMQPTCVDMLGMEAQDPNLLSGNWSPIDFSSYDTFSKA